MSRHGQGRVRAGRSGPGAAVHDPQGELAGALRAGLHDHTLCGMGGAWVQGGWELKEINK